MIAEKINYIILHHCYPNLKYHQDQMPEEEVMVPKGKCTLHR